MLRKVSVMHKYNFICACKKILAFCVPILPRLKNSVQHCVQILCTEFHPNWTLNVESTFVKTFTPFSTLWLLQCQFSQDSQ
jgi:hypothetical protein